MNRGLTGTFVPISDSAGERVQAFLPKPLPPNPPVSDAPGLRESIDRALVALGRLDSASTLLPDAQLFLYTYVRKEAVLSSQIEGTQSTLSDLLLFEMKEAPGVPLDDVTEVSNYVAALDHGLKRLRGGFPLSNRLLREVHGVLLSRGRGSGKDPGEFRRSQNWIGGTRPGNASFVPPPPDRVPEYMGLLEKFLHDDPIRTPPLLKAALAHVQFETIHPFLDGNGRVGRLLITLLLCAEGVLREPLLYLSLYLREHRDEYFRLLAAVREEGDWEKWLAFFARAVDTTATQAVETARRLGILFQEDRGRIEGVGRGAGTALRIHHELQRRPLATVSLLRSRTKISTPTIGKAMDALSRIGVIHEITGRKRNRVFAYTEYLKLIE